eukprot:XP_011683624.1 PREDICTED: uncharacterized protein LOC105447371 [Strongylocentrotus purpuratus]
MAANFSSAEDICEGENCQSITYVTYSVKEKKKLCHDCASKEGCIEKDIEGAIMENKGKLNTLKEKAKDKLKLCLVHGDQIRQCRKDTDIHLQALADEVDSVINKAIQTDTDREKEDAAKINQEFDEKNKKLQEKIRKNDEEREKRLKLNRTNAEKRREPINNKKHGLQTDILKIAEQKEKKIVELEKTWQDNTKTTENTVQTLDAVLEDDKNVVKDGHHVNTSVSDKLKKPLHEGEVEQITGTISGVRFVKGAGRKKYDGRIDWNDGKWKLIDTINVKDKIRSPAIVGCTDECNVNALISMAANFSSAEYICEGENCQSITDVAYYAKEKRRLCDDCASKEGCIGKARRGGSNLYCVKHDKDIELYCKTHHVALCYSCVMIDHHEQSCVRQDIEGAIMEYKAELNILKDNAKDKLKLCRVYGDQIRKCRKDTDTHLQALKDEVDSMVNEAIKTDKDIEKEDAAKINQEIDEKNNKLQEEIQKINEKVRKNDEEREKRLEVNRTNAEKRREPIDIKQNVLQTDIQKIAEVKEKKIVELEETWQDDTENTENTLQTLDTVLENDKNIVKDGHHVKTAVSDELKKPLNEGEDNIVISMAAKFSSAEDICEGKNCEAITDVTYYVKEKKKLCEDCATKEGCIGKARKGGSNLYCAKHDKDIELYCKTHGVALCYLCAMIDHQLQPCLKQGIEGAIMENKAKLNILKEKAKDKLKLCRAYGDLIRQCRKDTDTHLQALKDEVDSVINEVIQTDKDTEKEDAAKINQEIDEKNQKLKEEIRKNDEERGRRLE